MANSVQHLDAAHLAKIAHLVKQGKGELLGGLVGAGVGVGGGALLRHLLNRRYKTPEEKRSPARDMIMGGLLGAAAGAGTGRLIGQNGRFWSEPADMEVAGSGGVTEQDLLDMQEAAKQRGGGILPSYNPMTVAPYATTIGLSAIRPILNYFGDVSNKGGTPNWKNVPAGAAAPPPVTGFYAGINRPRTGQIQAGIAAYRFVNNLFRVLTGPGK
jgi:hypothetical protein